MKSIKAISIINLSLSTVLLLSACGADSTNPLAKYNGIKATTANDEKAVPQSIVAGGLFLIQLEGTNQINNGNFIEGQESELMIQVDPKSSSITKYSVQMTDFSSTDRPTLSATDKPGQYSLKWTPALGLIPGGNWGKTFKAQIQVIVLAATNPLLENIVTTQSLDIVVNRSHEQPQISGRTDLSKGIDEGVPSEFSVDVIDPGTLISPKIPEIQITPVMYSNTEAYRANGSRYVILNDSDVKHPNNPEKISATTYRFYYTIKVTDLALDRDRLGQEMPSAADVDLCFQMRAISVVGTLSDQLQICTKARYAAQPPVITFAENQTSEIKAGVPTTLTVKISTPHPLSLVTVKKPASIIAHLSGQKEINCAAETADKMNSQICIIKWTPACITTTTSVKIVVNADSSLGSKIKSSVVTKTVDVVPDLVGCPVTKAEVKAATKSATKTATKPAAKSSTTSSTEGKQL